MTILSIGLNISAQTVVKMEQNNGVYVMPCRVNGLNLKFIFDTGASDVSISLTEALFMLKNGYLSEDDLIGTEYYRIANGDIEEGTKIILRTIEIGKLKLYNVKASIVHNLSAPLLLGQSALSKLGKIEFDYSNSTLKILGGPSDYVVDNSEYKSSNNTNYNTANRYTGKKHKVTTGTILYPNPDGTGKKIVQVYSNTYAQLITKNTGYSDYWYVLYKGYKGYILKQAFNEE